MILVCIALLVVIGNPILQEVEGTAVRVVPQPGKVKDFAVLPATQVVIVGAGKNRGIKGVAAGRPFHPGRKRVSFLFVVEPKLVGEGRALEAIDDRGRALPFIRHSSGSPPVAQFHRVQAFQTKSLACVKGQVGGAESFMTPLPVISRIGFAVIG